MTDQRDAARQPSECPCSACVGQPIDRFGSDRYDCVSTAQHNGLGIIEYTNKAAAAGDYVNFWPDHVHDAITADATLNRCIGGL